MSGTIAENLARIYYKMERAARKSGRDPAEIKLVAVTKTVELKRIKEAFSAGARIFGENYVQEAQEKIEKLKKKPISWHFIGHLQKNKAKQAVELFDMIETVDSIELAKVISKRAKQPIDILIEVNIAGEKTKKGVDIQGVSKLAREIAELENVRLKGLMTIPPYHENSELSRPYFMTLRRIAERINRENIPGVSMHELSMGMSHDFEVAIEEGATIVRIGRAIFGEREQKKAAKKAKAKPGAGPAASTSKKTAKKASRSPGKG